MSAFDSGLTFQQTPGLVEYPEYDVDIVSPELPCGSAWLVNCLLELDVPVFKPWNANVPGEWEALGNYHYRYASAEEPWQRSLPALQHGRRFHFLAQPVPRVQHVWPYFYPGTAKTIFFVRDPRDALYSAWRRQRGTNPVAKDVDFAAFASGRYHHYPLTWSEYVLLFLRLWQAALAEREYLVLRYEDYRHDAAATLHRAVEFLGMKVDAVALHRAAQLSTFERLQRIEADLLACGAIDRPLNRAGCAYEYRHCFDAAMHCALGPRFASVYAWLGYEADLSDVPAPTSHAVCDIEPFLRAMQADRLPAQAQAWLRERVAAVTADIALDRWPA